MRASRPDPSGSPPGDDPERPRRVLHALAVSLPHLDGYTVRSRAILLEQLRSGRFEPTVVTSPFYPGDPASQDDEVRDGILHHRVAHPADVGGGAGLAATDRLVRWTYRLRHARWLRGTLARLGGTGGRGGADRAGGSRRATRRGPARRGLERLAAAAGMLEERLLMRRFRRGIRRVGAATRAELVHCHSPYATASPAIAAARDLGLPVVYEVRGVWEESGVESGLWARGGPRYRARRREEDRAMRRADAVVCICETLRSEVVGRGIERERVFVVPNAVDPALLRAAAEAAERRPPAALVRLRPRLRGTTFGYVGSVRELEGVDELVRGVAELLRRGRDVTLLVVGGGQTRELAALAEEAGLGERAVIAGPVPHAVVGAYYRLIDVFVISRPDLPVARLVTPLKPLEAMALGRPLVVSDLPALREIVRDGETGLVHRPGDPDHLADLGERLIDDPGLRRRLAEAGRRWVEEERTWERALAVLPEVYATAAQVAARRGGS